MPKKSASYDDFLSQQLREDPEFAFHYLSEAQQDEDPRALFTALRNLVNAHMGMTKLAEKTGIQRQTLYKMLSGEGNPGWIGMQTVLSSLGFSIEFKQSKAKGTKQKTSAKKTVKATGNIKSPNAKAIDKSRKKA
jgi:probable addiction module antidote protein